MKRLLPALFLCAFFTAPAFAQISSSLSAQGTSCFGTPDGSISVDLEACFTPLMVISDTDTAVIDGLNNDEYYGFMHGSNVADAEGFDVWAGVTSVGGVVVTTGYFVDSLHLDSTTLLGNGARDMFVTVHDTLGNLLWARTGGGADFDEGRGVFVKDNRIYVAGYFGGTADFGSTSLTSAGQYDGFIAKYDMAGNQLGVIAVGTTGITQLRRLVVHDSSIYVVGNYTGTVDVGGSSVSALGSGTYDHLVVCYDTSLVGTWALSGGGTGEDFAYDIDADTTGNQVNHIYIVGEFIGSADFGSGINLTSGGSSDGSIARITPAGSWDWVVQAGGTAADAARGIELSGTADSLFVSGYYSGVMTLGGSTATSNGQVDAFVARVDTLGNDGLLTTIGGSLSDFSYDIEMIGNGYLVVTGQMGGTVELENDTLISQGGLDGFAIKLNRQHMDVWSKSFGGSGEDSYTAVRKGAGDRLHATGFFNTTAFGAMDTLVSAGGKDVVTTNDDVFGNAVDIEFEDLFGGMNIINFIDNAGNTFQDSILVPSPDSIAITGLITPASSGTSLDGGIDASVSGGVPGYTYLWSTTDTTQDLTGLPIGTYTLTVTDTNGCMDSATFVIDTTAIPLIVDTGIVTNVDCFGFSTGAIDVVISGGNPPVSYAWSSGDSTQDVTGLMAGTYTVTITDLDSTFVRTYIVTQSPQLLAGQVTTPPSSGTALDGAIDLTVTGGTIPYSYVWSNSEITQDLTNIGVGIYTVTVTDSLGCFIVGSFAVDTLPALQLFLLASDVTCENSDNGTIDLTVQGGLPPYTYAWSNAATTEDLSQLAAGTYTVTVTDSAGQTAIGADTVFSNPTEPDPIVGPFIGAASAQSWINYTYSVAPTNGSSFDWLAVGGVVQSNTSNTAVIQWNAGPTGIIEVIETNAIGCTAVDSFEVTILFVGVEETHENAIVIYPNPATDVLNIQLPEAFSQATVSLMDLQGRIVMQPRQVVGNTAIDVQQYTSGIYILSIDYPEVRLTHEVIVK